MFSDGLNTNKLPTVEKSDSACRRLWYGRDIHRPFTEFLIPNLPLNVIPAYTGITAWKSFIKQ